MTTEERLEKMERELGRVKEVLARSRVEGTAKEIRAKSFVLEDENGKPRARLGITECGPGLMLLDEKGELCAGLSMTETGPLLALYDENGKGRVVLFVTQDGPHLALHDENGKVTWSAIK